MKNQDYNANLTVDATPAEVFKSINNVAAWWTPDLKGNSQKLNDEFTVQFEDIHLTTQRIIEMIPDKKVVWLVTACALNFTKDKAEWTNTRISFEISNDNGKTHLQFTHFGLVPEIECYNSCTRGWNYFIKGSLFKLLTEGKGTPGL